VENANLLNEVLAAALATARPENPPESRPYGTL